MVKLNAKIKDWTQKDLLAEYGRIVSVSPTLRIVGIETERQKEIEALPFVDVVFSIDAVDLDYAQVIGAAEDTNQDIIDAFNQNWVLSRLSDDDGLYTYDYTGRGVDICVFDTGVLAEHIEFRIGANYDNPAREDIEWHTPATPNSRVHTLFGHQEGPFSSTPSKAHGTGCAAQAAGANVGIAKDSRIISMAYFPNIIVEIIENLIQFHLHKVGNGILRPTVLSTSISVTPNPNSLAIRQAWDAIFSAIAEAGIFHVTSAGNSTTSLRKIEEYLDIAPMYFYTTVFRIEPEVISVGCTEARWDSIAGYSNYGRGINIFAPGHNSRSAKLTVNNLVPDTTIIDEYVLFGGTSSACPTVAGALACWLEKENLPMLTQGVLPVYADGAWSWAGGTNRRTDLLAKQAEFITEWSAAWETQKHFTATNTLDDEILSDIENWDNGWPTDDALDDTPETPKDGSPRLILNVQGSPFIQLTGKSPEYGTIELIAGKTAYTYGRDQIRLSISGENVVVANQSDGTLQTLTPGNQYEGLSGNQRHRVKNLGNGKVLVNSPQRYSIE